MRVRLRLTLLYAGLLLGSTVLLLGLSAWLLRGHLDRTLPEGLADDIFGRLLTQYGIAVAGVALLAIATGWVVAGRALAPTEELVAQLARSNEAQRQFVANASHELRSPLTVIRTEAEVTLADPDATMDDLREMGRIVLEATDRTEMLLEGLLTLALSQRGLCRDEPVDLADLARRVVERAGPEAAEAGVRLALAAPRPVVVRGDEGLLERLLGNLTENAIRHNARGGFAELSIVRRAEQAVVRVVNGGAQIPADAVARLTEPFQRLDRWSARRGSGLGLSIVAAVTEIHRGELALAAREAGGLDAEVVLPAAAAGDLMPPIRPNPYRADHARLDSPPTAPARRAGS